MEQLLSISAFVTISLIIIITLNRENRIWGICISVVAGISLMLFAVPYLSQIVNTFKELEQGLDPATVRWLGILIKMFIVATLGEGVLATCRDVGESSMAFKLELAIKIILCAMSLPIIMELVGLMLETIKK